MESCLSDLHLNWCIIYLHDIIVFSQTHEGHLQRVKAVFNKLKAAGLKLKPSKCDLFKQEINYLGHVVSKEEVSIPHQLQGKVRKHLDTWLRQGITGHYKIPNASQVVTV